MKVGKSQVRAATLLLILLIATLPIFGIPPHSSVSGSGDGPGALLTGNIVDSLGPDEDSDGHSDYLIVGVEVNVTQAGVYIVSVSSLRDENNWINVYDSKT